MNPKFILIAFIFQCSGNSLGSSSLYSTCTIWAVNAGLDFSQNRRKLSYCAHTHAHTNHQLSKVIWEIGELARQLRTLIVRLGPQHWPCHHWHGDYQFQFLVLKCPPPEAKEAIWGGHATGHDGVCPGGVFITSHRKNNLWSIYWVSKGWLSVW